MERVLKKFLFLAFATPQELDLLEEAVCLAIYGKRTLGPLTVAAANDVPAAIPVAEHDPEAAPPRIVVGTDALQKALCEGELTALVTSTNGIDLFKVPLTYWRARNPWGAATLDLQIEEGGEGAELVGQALVIDTAELPKWKAVVDRAVGAEALPASIGHEEIDPTRPPPDGGERIWNKLDGEQWYKMRVENWTSKYPPSRAADIAAGRLVGLRSDRVKSLRKALAPPDWRKRGRRPGT